MLQETYQKKAIPELMGEFKISNRLAVPKIQKAVVNIGTGRIRDEKQLEVIQKHLSIITGQHPVPRRAKKAIAAFKTRVGMVIGYSATLRGKRMYEFLDRLVGVALPRTRDFMGIPASAFDRDGNLTIGIKEHIVFPELIGEDVRFIFGLEVTVVTTAKSRQEGIALLRSLGFPIQKS
ncbi:MAG: 50S ribosomal protein L5 [Candidatus Sungbacteria bacterium RIFCSPHIGHO2_02_FULL_49_12]|uniref:Large ribosomal subunit protein uL5 n=1 Tax=Candidatus Sungbacteria bacterium RIFCSPHIGHO2_02_FULL_49_12 TaxID=1802271 RepID=A0A1G2KM90_9BACT|nr:MAG: 50S ribosomal protein L5 [Candidatus Sungbacteria bacterium RIFCSPHIGHO2_02_FULL_49_12]